jgi:predicted nucleotidyltransferase
LLRELARRRSREGEAFQRYVERLRSAFPRSAIVLFGSRARGDAGPMSDYDIAVILPPEECRPEAKHLVAEKALRLREPSWPLSLDIVVLCVDELWDPLVRQMLSQCKLLYDALGLASVLACRGSREE